MLLNDEEMLIGSYIVCTILQPCFNMERCAISDCIHFKSSTDQCN